MRHVRRSYLEAARALPRPCGGGCPALPPVSMEATLPGMDDIRQTLELARDLAEEAGRLTMGYFRSTFAVDYKADNSPVTVADREAEQLIRRRLADRFPEHGILGEEFGTSKTDSPWTWMIDPIDGTKSFIHGVPLYAVLIALAHEGEPVLGVIHCPPLAETVYAAKGFGCYWNGEPCSVSDTGDLAKARVQATDFADLHRMRPGFCGALLEAAGSCRTWGDAYGYLLVATGRADAMIDPVFSPWDTGPLGPIIREAGGRFTDLDGNAVGVPTSGLATNGRVHDQILALG